jgi:hypothetical protein
MSRVFYSQLVPDHPPEADFPGSEVPIGSTLSLSAPVILATYTELKHSWNWIMGKFTVNE